MLSVKKFRQGVEDRLSAALGTAVKILKHSPVGGGCINSAFKLDTSSGSFFLKINNASRYPGMFEAEARGLRLLNAAQCIKIPSVLTIGDVEDQSFIVMEYIDQSRRLREFDKNFGESLACLHTHRSVNFGLDHSNYIGSLVQHNEPGDDWAFFFREMRLKPQIEIALGNGRINAREASLFEGLFSRLNGIFPEDAPSLLHGDLWSGNLIADENGMPVLVDPAVYYGHREAELAFTRLFGGFGTSFYSSYNEALPIASGFEERVDIYNLYPLMVHLNLFGRSYWSGVSSTLKRF